MSSPAAADLPMTDTVTDPPTAAPSPVTARAVVFVAARREQAETLGRDLAELTGDPDGFAASLGRAFRELSDPEYQEGEHRIAPGLGPTHGVRWPLLAAIQRGFREATRRERPAGWLYLADRLYREERLEERWFAFGLLERLLDDDAERAWQLLRRGAREAGDWITVDTLAHPYGRGILAEPYRWAELEQLVFSPSRWERRLVGSTIATIPFVDRRSGRAPAVATHALPIVGQLIGDREPDVQKALSWALRSLVRVDGEAVAAFCDAQARLASTTDDGHRAWVIRDVLPKLDPALASELRARLDGIRRRPGAPSTSEAAARAARFAGPTGLPDPTTLPEPPL
jgi:3-methyladenine DNA glycosylase AlkD